MKQSFAVLGLCLLIAGPGAASADDNAPTFIDGVYAITSDDAVDEGAVGLIELDRGAPLQGSITLVIAQAGQILTETCDIVGGTLVADGVTGTASFSISCPSAGDLERDFVWVVTDLRGSRAESVRFQQTDLSLAGGVLALNFDALPRNVSLD